MLSGPTYSKKHYYHFTGYIRKGNNSHALQFLSWLYSVHHDRPSFMVMVFFFNIKSANSHLSLPLGEMHNSWPSPGEASGAHLAFSDVSNAVLEFHVLSWPSNKLPSLFWTGIYLHYTWGYSYFILGHLSWQIWRDSTPLRGTKLRLLLWKSDYYGLSATREWNLILPAIGDFLDLVAGL